MITNEQRQLNEQRQIFQDPEINHSQTFIKIKQSTLSLEKEHHFLLNASRRCLWSQPSLKGLSGRSPQITCITMGRGLTSSVDLPTYWIRNPAVRFRWLLCTLAFKISTGTRLDWGRSTFPHYGKSSVLGVSADRSANILRPHLTPDLSWIFCTMRWCSPTSPPFLMEVMWCDDKN